MTARNATEIVIACENQLGFTHDVSKRGLAECRRIEAGKIIRKMKADGLTLEDFEIALAYSYARREPVKSPAALAWRVKAAKERAAEPEVVLTDLSASVQAALDWELKQPVADTSWITRLTRAQGPARADLLADWKEANRGRG